MIVSVLAIAAIVCAFVQIGLSVDLSVLALALVAIAAGLYAFWLGGVSKLAGWFCLFWISGELLISYFSKTILGQIINSNLYTPNNSFLVEMICCIALLIALIVSDWIPIGRPLKPITDLSTLSWLSWWCFPIGLGVGLFHQFSDRGVSGPEYGGLTMFVSLMYLGIICRTAYVLLKSGGRKHLDIVLLLMLVIGSFSGLLSTGRGNTALPVICWVVTVLFFKGRMPWRYVALLACGAIVFVALVPVILAFRYMGFRDMTLAGEVNAFEYIVPTLLEGGGEFSHLSTLSTNHKGEYYDYYQGKANLVINRFSSIQEIDPAIAATDASEPMGADILVSAIRSQIPKFIDPNKPTETNAFIILVDQGYTNKGNGTHPTLPMPGELYAAFGMWGVLIGPFIIFLLYLLVLKKVGWNLYGNVFSIFILCSSLLTWPEYGVSDFIAMMARSIPLYLLIVYALTKVLGLLRRQDFTAPAPATFLTGAYRQ